MAGTANQPGDRNAASPTAWEDRALRQESLGQRKSGLYFLPYALHELHRTNLISECAACRVSWIGSVSVRQTQTKCIRVFILFPSASLQPNPGKFLRRQLLGWPRNRIQVAKSRCGAGTRSS